MYQIEIIIKYDLEFKTDLKSGHVSFAFYRSSNKILFDDILLDSHHQSFKNLLDELISPDELTMRFYIDSLNSIDKFNIGKDNRYQISPLLKLVFELSEDEILYYKLKYQHVFDNIYSPFEIIVNKRYA